MRVKILKRSFAGAEFAPDIRVLKVGGQSSAGVERLEFELPAEWKGLSVTLHVQWLDGTLPAPVLLDDEDSVAVDKTLTASPGGQWMLLAPGAGILQHCAAGRSQRKDQRRDGGHRSNPGGECQGPGRDGGPDGNGRG